MRARQWTAAVAVAVAVWATTAAVMQATRPVEEGRLAGLELALTAFVDVWRGDTVEEAVWGASAVAVRESERGMVLLTAAHVVRGCEGSRMWVRRYDGREFGEFSEAVPGWVKEEGDLAVLEVPGARGWPVLPVLREGVPRRFEACVTVGQTPVGVPLAYAGAVLGVVPEVERRTVPGPHGPEYTGCVVVSAHAYYGFSGGPALVWREGQWVVFGVVVSGTMYGAALQPWQIWIWPVGEALEEIER